jgi:hypothetical protein
MTGEAEVIYLTRSAAARQARVTRNTILLWERAGWLHPRLLGLNGQPRNMIALPELERLLDERKRPDPAQVWGDPA